MSYENSYTGQALISRKFKLIFVSYIARRACSCNVDHAFSSLYLLSGTFRQGKLLLLTLFYLSCTLTM